MQNNISQENLEKDYKTCAVIPVFNGAATIYDVVLRARLYVDRIFVIDDGSKDNTAIVAEKAGATVIRHSQNKGKGAALRTGFASALGSDYDIIITLDGDSQHNPDEIPLFLDRINSKDVDIVIGNRMRELCLFPRLRLFGNRVSTFFISRLCHQPIPDSQCGFRAYKRHVLSVLRFSGNFFDAESEILVLAAKHGFKIDSIPISTIYSTNGLESYYRPVIDSARIFWKLYEIVVLKKYSNGQHP